MGRSYKAELQDWEPPHWPEPPPAEDLPEQLDRPDDLDPPLPTDPGPYWSSPAAA
jgi:hypothetical protein